MMNLYEFLESERESTVDRAATELSETPLRSYRKSEDSTNRERLAQLFDVTVESIHRKNLIPMMEFSEKIAEERYHQQFDLQEVQTAFNVLEEVIWGKIGEKLNPQEFPKAFGLVSTVMGFGKESIATTYLSLVTQKKRLPPDLEVLCKGI